MKIALVLSVVANAMLLVLSRGDDSAKKSNLPTATSHCDLLKTDLAFFIEGLEKGNDPYYTPVVVTTISRLLPSCFPAQREKIDASFADLRNHLLYLVAANTSQEQKREAHNNALRIFRELHALYGSSI
jgi:hypothetical protein